MHHPILPPLELERHTLENGLRLVLHRDSTLPLVALNLWYHVGSANESPGRTGLAHLFEHLLFQGSEHVDTNGHFRQIQQAGGTANGSTWFDRTNYHCLIPAHQLDLALWLESDRMGFFLPAVTREKLDNQRAVVLNERRQRVDNQPYGRAFERLHELLYPTHHPYHSPVIGYVEDLLATQLDDVRDFFSEYYAPSNAVLTLAGDFADDAAERIGRYFDEIPGGSPARQPQVPEAGTESGERREVMADQVELARIYLGYQVPPYGTLEWHAADLLAGALADGKSSRLYEDLVYRRQLAQDVAVSVLPTEKVATLVVIATAVPGGRPEELEAALDEHLDLLAVQDIAERCLERARQRVFMLHTHQLQTLERRADLFSMAATYFDDPRRVASEIGIYRRLGGAELVNLARRFLRREQRAVVTVIPEKEHSKGAAAVISDVTVSEAAR